MTKLNEFNVNVIPTEALDLESTRGHTVVDMTTPQQPIACTLPTGDAARQVQEWADLQNDVRTSEALDRGVALTFDIALAERVEDLAAREAACCGFLSITTHRGSDSVRMEITSDNPDAAPIIALLAGTATR